MDYLQWTAALGRRTDDGSTERAHCEASARGKGKGAEESRARLVPPPLPEPLTYLFVWWTELHAARGQSMHGIAPLTYADLDAWARMTGRDPEPFETDLLLRLDATFRAASVS